MYKGGSVLQQATLLLEDGTVFEGQSLGAQGCAVGEVVFHTSMTGYQEILTDPSYAEQLITFTYPHIGNVGTNAKDNESEQVYAKGAIFQQPILVTSNWRADSSLSAFFEKHQVVAICGIDTRALTRKIRDQGAMKACLYTSPQFNKQDAVRAIEDFAGLKGCDLAIKVTTKNTYQWTETLWQQAPPTSLKFHVVVVDYGVKRSILRHLVALGAKVTVVPATTDYETILAHQPDGILLSNGPGDPAACTYAIKTIQALLNYDVPLFGICLGHQLLGLSLGARCLKMKLGHHGANHPVKAVQTGQVLITSQNHGFAIDEQSLPSDLKVTHRSLFDGTLQGFQHKQLPVFSFQGHPEASPGPEDVTPLFQQFADYMQQYQDVRHQKINKEAPHVETN